MNSYPLSVIAEKIGARTVGDINKQIKEPVNLKAGNIEQDVIMWCKRGRESVFPEIHYGTIICENLHPDYIQPQCTYLVVDNARQAFQKMMKYFFQRPLPVGISASATIGKDVRMGANVYIGHHVVIEDNCAIGDNSRIDHNTVIRFGTLIGNGVDIGCNTSIGGSGFGFEKNEEMAYEPIPHIGNVIIEDDVEIGDNVVIDRAPMGSTLIGKNSKIDNLSYIAHGVRIGSNCLVIGGAVINGSSVVGDNVWISPNSTIIHKVHIGENSVIGIGSVVLRDVTEGTTVAGNPARMISKIKTDE